MSATGATVSGIVSSCFERCRSGLPEKKCSGYSPSCGVAAGGEIREAVYAMTKSTPLPDPRNGARYRGRPCSYDSPSVLAITTKCVGMSRKRRYNDIYQLSRQPPPLALI